jgi:hypothetical protein
LIVPPGPDRPDRDRRTTPDRRAVARGGRRREERYQSDRETIVSLLTELAKLREENTLLRRAALSFGALAERLNVVVQSLRS